jgi:hypothetical protein
MLGTFAAIALACAALPWRRVGVAALGLAGLGICLWSLHVYMPIAGQHWGSRDAVRAYYAQRTIYGEKLVYFGTRQLYDDWHDVRTHWTFETFVPYGLYLGQPMTITVHVTKPDDDRVVETEVVLAGEVSRIGDHDVELELSATERAKLDPLIARGEKSAKVRRSSVRVVDADRLIAWQLYWRGDQFWSGGEIWDYLPEMKTTFAKNDNADFINYLNDRKRAPLGRRYFLITDAGRATSLRALLPTQRAKESFIVINTDSNKFSLVAFVL